MEKVSTLQKIGWSIRLFLVLGVSALLWRSYRQMPPKPSNKNVILEYQIKVLLKEDSILEIQKHERLNRLDSLPDDSIKRIITNWLARNP